MIHSDIAASLLKNKRAIVLDDNRTNLRIISNTLRSRGMKVDRFLNYKTFMVALHSFDFDVIIIDHSLQSKDSVEVAKLVREQNLQTPIMLLISSSQSYATISDKEIFQGILRKPLKPDRLQEALISIFSRPVTSIAADETAAAGDAHELQERRILVVEDNPINQKIVSKVLSKLGYNFNLVESGEAAVDVFRTQFYDLVLMDMILPGISGNEAIQKIKEMRPEKPSVFIAVTGKAYAHEKETMLAEEVDDYLMKPYSINDIKTILEKWRTKLSVNS